jgi:para-nitrobenzyl esterase
MGEDCLVLNVLTPRADKGGRPVMVYLHGGGFDSGSGAVHTLGDRFVVEEDVVLVTVNHRLSLLGYLYLGEVSARFAQGNVGLLDLVAALRWVRDNIAQFGGDPGKVTIFGESGGGAKVSYMLSMPQAQGLFRAAIIQSAGLTSPMGRQDGTEVAKALLQKVGINATDVAHLQNMPATELLKQAPGGSRIMPVLDSQTVLRGPWENGPPSSASSVPIIVGTCADEATLFLGLPEPKLFSIDWPDVAPRLGTLAKKPADTFTTAIAAYRRAYPAASATDVFFRMASISFLGWNGRSIADAKATQPPPVYLYRMEYDTGIPPGLRAFHTCELPLANRMVWQPKAETLSKQIAGAWAAFARTGGNPNHIGMPQWVRYQPGAAGSVMLFDLQTRVGPDPSFEPETLLRNALGVPSLV